MKLKGLIALLMLSISIAKAQDFDNYHTLLSVGEMPNDFRLMASEKYRKELEEIKNQKISKETKNIKRNFALETNFAITDLMMSGRVIYGDKLSTYINKIADLILKDDKELRDKLRFYILKSSVANALCTNQGIIFITSGLIAQVENEAQLAYIISHEIVHFKKQHNFEAFKKREAILKGAGKRSTVTIEEKLKTLYKYSKKNETEADQLGFEFFLKTNYNPYAAYSSMDVLLYSYLPYDMIDWNPEIFETQFYKFPKSYINSKKVEVNADEDEDDEYLTHPNIGKRKSNLTYLLNKENVDSNGKSYFLISREEFLNVQKIARYELASLYLKDANPLMAYYISYLLDNTYGESYYTNKIKTMSIYSLARHSAYDYDLDNYGCDIDFYEGEIKNVAYFFTKIKTKELLVLAAKYLWEKSVKYPDDLQIKNMRDQVFTDMFSIYELSINKFLNFKPIIIDSTKENISKVEKMKNKQKAKSEKYYIGAFYEFLNDKTFVKYINQIYNKPNTSSNLSNNEDSEENEDESEDEIRKTKESSKIKITFFNKKTKETNLEKINTVVMFEPEYSAVIKNKTYPLQEEETQSIIASYYKEIANQQGFDVIILDKVGQENFNTESFNKYALLRDWFIERINNDTLSMELYQKEFIKESFKNYETKYLGWAGYKYTMDVHEFEPLACAISVVLWPLFPFYLGFQLSKDRNLENLLLIYNVETGKPVLVDYSKYRKKPKKFTMKAIIYNQIYYLKNGK